MKIETRAVHAGRHGESWPTDRSPALLAKYGKDFPKVTTFTIDELFGGWTKAQRDHFDDGAIFDQILAAKK